MLFRKKHPRSCQYCTYSTAIEEGQVLCSKKGIRQQESPCGSFRYDPCKRIPPKNTVLNFSQYSEDDFKL